MNSIKDTLLFVLFQRNIYFSLIEAFNGEKIFPYKEYILHSTQWDICALKMKY